MKGRDITLDIIRILACCMIVFMHAPMPSASASGPFLMGLSYLTAPGIGLFFMVSGALLLPVKDDYFTFMRRRLSKIVLPTVAWTAIYVALNIYMSQSEINIMRTVLSFPFAPQGNGVLWFMYTMTGIYLLAPILSAWLEKASVREIECVLLIWCVTLCYPILENWLAIGTGTTGILYYFTGYAGYFLLGYYLKNYGRRIAAAAPALIAAIGLALVMVLKYKGIEFDFYRLFWYESIFIAALACLIWMVVGKAVSLAKNTLKNGGGKFSVYQCVVECKFWRLPYAYPHNALLALACGLDRGHYKLCRPDHYGCGAHIGTEHASVTYDGQSAGAEPSGGLSPKKIKPRLHYIDNLRVLACFLVLLTHSTMPSHNPEADGSTIHIFPRTFIIALLTLLTGYALTRLLSLLPKGKYITGA